MRAERFLRLRLNYYRIFVFFFIGFTDALLSHLKKVSLINCCTRTHTHAALDSTFINSMSHCWDVFTARSSCLKEPRRRRRRISVIQTERTIKIKRFLNGRLRNKHTLCPPSNDLGGGYAIIVNISVYIDLKI